QLFGYEQVAKRIANIRLTWIRSEVILNFADGEQQICISGGMQSLSDSSLWQITEVHRRMLHIFLKFA
ncbi:MAG: hypothetical protein ACLTL4_06810, partial [Hominisplanchenecus sp.]|uniref:hypothetical protein n=1 Tax=Hominisplanchenecus sp. TaxID=3038130 RepID=UPI003994EDF9